MQNNSKQFKKFKKTPLLLAGLFLIFSVAALLWTYKEIKATEADSHKAQAEWQAETVRRDEIRSLERSIRDVEGERRELESHFAESANIVPFLDTMEKLAQLAGAESEVTAVDIPKDKDELVVSLQTKGDFAAAYKFVKLLENSPYELEIGAMDLQRSTVGEEGGSFWEGHFTIHLLSFVK